MVITISCPSCAASFPVDPAKIPEAGVNVRCSACAHVFRVERPSEPAPEPPVVEELETSSWAEPAVEEAPEAEASSWAEPAVEEEPEPEASSWAEPAVEGTPEPEDTTWEEPAAEETSDEWVVETEDDGMAGMVAEPAPAADDSMSSFFGGAPAVEAEPEPEAEAAPSFEEPAVEEPSFEAATFEEPAVEEPESEPEPEPEAEAAPAVQGFSFGQRDPLEKARRLARVLVSDMIMYNPERHERALAGNTLKEDFEEEIEKSFKEYVEQVGEEIAGSTDFWSEALNDVLAKGESLF